MLKIINNFLRKKYWIYVFPALMDFSLGFLLLLVSIKAVQLGTAPFKLGILGSVWGISYFISNLVLSRFAHKRTANLFMVLGCLSFVAIAPGFIFFHSLAALFILAFLLGPATAFFFIGFQLFMGEGANLSVLKSTALYTLGWSTGLAFGFLVSGALVGLPPVISILPVVASSLLIILGLRFIGKFSARDRAGKKKENRHVFSGLDKTISPGTEKAYLLLGWVGIFTVSIVSGGIRFLMPKLIIDFFGLSPVVAGALLFLSFVIQAVFGLLLMKFPGWRYNFKAHSRMELLGLAGVFLALVTSGVTGVIILSVVVGIYSGHAFYNGVFYSLCQHQKRGRNVVVNESLVGISAIIGPLILGVALQAGISYFFLVPVLLIAVTYFIQAFLVRSVAS
ncbi:MAG: MFS transporter [Candidatus Omnitrophica bacterium]|nr:MFS transporter [Candidatus Omnitrophota bacterium]